MRRRSARSRIRAAVVICALVVPAIAAHAQPSLTLDEAIEAARQTSQALERSRLGIDAARAGRAQARASFGPRVDASAGAAYLANPPDGITIPAGAFGTVPDPLSTFPALVPERPVVIVPDPENLGLSARVEVQQPIYTWGKLHAAHDAALAALDASMARHAQSEREIRRSVTLAYAGIVAGRASVPLVETIAHRLEDRAEDARRRFDAGAVTRSEVLTEESRVASARLQLVRARQGLESTEAALRRLIGREFSHLAAVDPPPELPSEHGLLDDAHANDPRLRELRATSEQAAVQVRVATASRPFLPDIGFRIQAEVQGQRVPFIQANWIDTWRANLTISIGASALIYDGGASSAEQRSARAVYRQSLSAVTEYVDSLPLQVRRTVEHYRIAEAMLAESEARIASAEEQRRVARVAFENEIITRAELIGAEVGVLEARLTEVGARLELSVAFAELEYLIGPLR